MILQVNYLPDGIMLCCAYNCSFKIVNLGNQGQTSIHLG